MLLKLKISSNFDNFIKLLPISIIDTNEKKKNFSKVYSII